MQLDRSWTHRTENERQREHDFDNWLQELVVAVERAVDPKSTDPAGDRRAIVAISDELKRLYREANRRKPSKPRTAGPARPKKR